jgi:hypothetical protein
MVFWYKFKIKGSYTLSKHQIYHQIIGVLLILHPNYFCIDFTIKLFW